MHLDFLLVLDNEVRQNNLGYVRDGSEIKRLGLESGLVDRQDTWSAAKFAPGTSPRRVGRAEVNHYSVSRVHRLHPVCGICAELATEFGEQS